MRKLERLIELGRQRQRARWQGYGFIGDYHGGAYETEFVSPYTKSAGNVDAPVMVVLQDWSSHEWLAGPLRRELEEFGRMPSLPTNRNLEALLRRHFDVELSDIFATNLFPFVKRGSMTAQIATRDLVRAAREFALPQIAIVAPILVICLGKASFTALQLADGRPPSKRLQEAIEAPFVTNGSQVWCQAHTGSVGRNIRNRGGVDRVNEDWSQMAKAFRTCYGTIG